MKYTTLLLLFLAISLFSNAGDKYVIKPAGYQENTTTIQAKSNQLSSMNKVGGFFRLKEYSITEQKNIETDLVTFFIGKNDETNITFSINCAKPIKLHYSITDAKGKHTVKISQPNEYYRFEKDLDISSFKNGVCTLNVYNEKNELIYSTTFEKAAL